MKKLTTRIMFALLAAVMVFCLAGCGGTDNPSSSDAGAGASAGGNGGGSAPEATTLKIYLFSQAEGFDRIAAKFEEETKDTLNIKLDFVWSDAQTHREKVPLMMGNQEEADLVFDAYWMNLSTMHNQGAYSAAITPVSPSLWIRGSPMP